MTIISEEQTVYKFDIDCSKMPSYEDFDFWTRKETFFSNLFIQLDKLTNPCIYWFELDNDSFSSEIKMRTDSFRTDKSIHKRTIPAKNKNDLSKYLYVGIRKGGVRKKDGLLNIASRIFHHLGYYSIGSTQGLQLAYWSQYKLKLSVIELTKEAEAYLNIIEKFYAIKFKPLLGKH